MKEEQLFRKNPNTQILKDHHILTFWQPSWFERFNAGFCLWVWKRAECVI